MPHPLHAPRVNNNDDVVQVIGLHVAPGDKVAKGDLIAEVETDKSVAEVEAEEDGYVLQVLCELDQQVPVGSVLLWVGDNPDEEVPQSATVTPEPAPAGGTARPTAKARALLKRHQLTADQVPACGERLTVSDVEDFLARQARAQGAPSTAAGATPQPVAEPMPQTAGELQGLSTEERGMLHTVSWHRDYAVSTYLEMEYDPAPWEAYAKTYAEAHKLMLSPLLSLMARRLVELTAASPNLNSTMVGERKYRYDQVNLGFTVQAGETLYLAVLEAAEAMDTAQFVEAMGALQRRAMAKKLKAAQTQGATVSFSSMARWNISRHIPVLAPHTSLMVAHAAPRDHTKAVLGASYDHRVLSGFEVARTLQQLSQPPA